MDTKNKEKILKFPDGFLWGASTSAYQIEGGITNDWSEWEKENASRLAEKAKTYWQPWQQRKFPEMFERANYICGQACNSYEMFNRDVECLKEINCNAYRLGIEWARIEPQKGKWDMDAIGHYKKILQALKKNNIKVVLTLWHWTNPLWLIKEGGWENKKAVDHYIRYVELIIKELGGFVDYWVTLNEPLMVIGHGYLTGKFPPNKKGNIISAIKLFNNFVNAHKRGYKVIHRKYPCARVSIAMTTGYFSPAHSWNPIEYLIVKLAHYFRNDWFLKKVEKAIDFIGVNYYHHDRIIWRPPFKKNLNKEVDDRGWEFFPKGIYYVLKNYKKYKKPLIVLENGTADAEDKLREIYIKGHLQGVHRAISEGVDVRGYFYWSLLDNFEWAEGFWPKFGLFKVNRKTFERIARPSARTYADICKNNRVTLKN